MKIVAYVILLAFISFFFWEGRNELSLEVTCFWKVSEQLCYVGYERGRTLPLYGRDRQYLHVLANGRQKSGLPLPPATLSEDSGKFVLAVFVCHWWCVMVEFCLVDNYFFFPNKILEVFYLDCRSRISKLGNTTF